MLGRNEKFEVKPIRFYKDEDIKVTNMEKGTLVLAHVKSFYHGVAEMEVPGFETQRTVMYVEDVNIFESIEKNEKYLISVIGNKVLARVKEITQGIIVLERNSVIKDTLSFLSIGNIVTATIERVVPYGAFVDIGNGIVSLLHITEVSKIRWFDGLEELFSRGEAIKVKIIDLDKKNLHFKVSRKDAYERIPMHKDMCIKCRCSSCLADQTGVFVEYDPANIGIMDIPDGMDPSVFGGKSVQLRIKRDTEAGFKGDFFAFV